MRKDGFSLTFDTGNSAFDGSGFQNETADILRKVAAAVERGTRAAPIYDSNGNRIGRFDLEAREAGVQ